MGTYTPLVSVIITTRNEEANIKNCLDSVLAQTYPRSCIEIVVVDNGSVDRTREVAARYTRLIYTRGPERSAQRNYGVGQSSGEYILYLDADMILSPGVVRECVDTCAGSGCGALYIPEKIVGRGFWIQVRDFERSFYNATCIDCVRFISRAQFLAAGGFDESLTGPEDWDFDMRLRRTARTGIIRSPIYHNEGDFDMFRYVRKKMYYAGSFDGYIAKWGRDNACVRKQFGLLYRYFLVFVEQGKWVRLVCHPLRALGMYLLRFVVGVSYLSRRIGIIS